MFIKLKLKKRFSHVGLQSRMWAIEVGSLHALLFQFFSHLLLICFIGSEKNTVNLSFPL